MTVEIWEWAASTGFEELRECAEEVREHEIYATLAEEGGLRELVKKGVPLDVLDNLMSLVAQLMLKQKAD